MSEFGVFFFNSYHNLYEDILFEKWQIIFNPSINFCEDVLFEKWQIVDM